MGTGTGWRRNSQGVSGERASDRQALGKEGTVVCFVLLFLFPSFHSPLCCDLSSRIQVNKCHIFQPIFTPGNAPSPSPLSCCSGSVTTGIASPQPHPHAS